jgi:hypothetical protein
LAQEAGVPRNALTQRHTDLRNEFYERVKERGATPDVEVRLREQIAKLKKTVANKDKELTRLRSDVPALLRVINQITAENTELRETLKMPPANVVPLCRHTGSSTESVRPDLHSDDRRPGVGVSGWRNETTRSSTTRDCETSRNAIRAASGFDDESALEFHQSG